MLLFNWAIFSFKRPKNTSVAILYFFVFSVSELPILIFLEMYSTTEVLASINRFAIDSWMYAVKSLCVL